MDDLLAEFLTETNENLGELDVALVRLERSPGDRETLSLIFRLVHTIKGTCGFLGLARLERVAHAAENVLGRVRDGELAVTPGMIGPVLAALDRIKVIVASLSATEAEPEGDDSALIAALGAIAAGETAPAAEPAPAMPEEPAAAEPAVAAQTIRVGVDVLENLMTLVSELVLTRNQLLQLARTQESSTFSAPLQRLSHITSDLQEGVMKTRMQPIGNAWNKLPRLVRDLSHELGKRIELRMQGADTELDRQVLELIRDPLTHMVRNSADHGLETPEARRVAGKPESGCITLNAFHEGGHIIIEVSDDGRGLPLDKIRARALAQGLASEAELAGMTDQQIQRFIFRAGFSTAAEVTAVSGRGVGMDVVKTNIERIGGTIDLRSTPGSGTVFTIKIPLTLAIVAALIVEAAGERFAVPQISVVELVRVAISGGARNPDGAAGEAEERAVDAVIDRIDGTPVLRLREKLMPLVALGELLRLDAAPEPDPTIVVVQIGAAQFGIIVGRVFDTEEIVVKPVAPVLNEIKVFGGNTILGDGSVIMILDTNGIARAAGIAGNGEIRRAASAAPAASTQHSAERQALLLFRAAGETQKAVPLGLVSRLEEIPRARIEHACGMAATQYRGRLMPLIGFEGPVASGAAQSATQPVLVFADGARCMGLMVDEIVDVVEDWLQVELLTDRPGILGSAVIAGQATEVIDTGFWLTRAWHDWFGQARRCGPARILVVEDSDFFRRLVGPALSTAGFDVTVVDRAAKALGLRDAGRMFEAIVSDIEMPEMDGLEFARQVRVGGIWAGLPMIALTGRAGPEDEAAGRAAGFTDYVAKFDRNALLGSLLECLAEPSAQAGALARAA